MRTGKIGIRKYQHSRKVSDIDNHTCQCGQAPQSVTHILIPEEGKKWKEKKEKKSDQDKRPAGYQTLKPLTPKPFPPYHQSKERRSFHDIMDKEYRIFFFEFPIQNWPLATDLSLAQRKTRKKNITTNSNCQSC